MCIIHALCRFITRCVPLMLRRFRAVYSGRDRNRDRWTLPSVTPCRFRVRCEGDWDRNRKLRPSWAQRICSRDAVSLSHDAASFFASCFVTRGKTRLSCFVPPSKLVGCIGLGRWGAVFRIGPIRLGPDGGEACLSEVALRHFGLSMLFLCCLCYAFGQWRGSGGKAMLGKIAIQSAVSGRGQKHHMELRQRQDKD
jgi:hypothetical protein